MAITKDVKGHHNRAENSYFEDFGVLKTDEKYNEYLTNDTFTSSK